MLFSGFRRKRHLKVGDSEDELSRRKSLLQFYHKAPTDDISLEEFEQLAVERLKVLRAFEIAAAKFNKFSQEYRDSVVADLRRQKLHAYVGHVPEDSAGAAILRKDNISHFILLLAFCQTQDLRRWFISMEIDLFRFRLQNESQAGLQDFFRDSKMDFKAISAEEKAAHAEDIIDSSRDLTATKLETMDVYKVPFTEVLKLVSERAVFLRGGEAYVPAESIGAVVESRYRVHLSQMLAQTARALPRLDEEDRLLPILRALTKMEVGCGFDAGQATDAVTPEMIDQLSKESFPLCMKSTHTALRSNHHLRHGARMQYGLFLKGVGLGLQDALRFWREEFSKHVGAENFDKRYSYNIRHNYGTEGKRTNYTPYSCGKIITTNPPGPGDAHGCPFRHFDHKKLEERLKEEGIRDANLREVMDYVDKGHYQLACTTTFRITQKSPELAQVIGHPNEYYQLSRQFRDSSASKDGKTGSMRSIKTTKSLMYSQPVGKQKDEFDDDDADLDKILAEAEMKEAEAEPEETAMEH
ncbi:DNA primase large subunit [Ixodes scapularis]|uniref:DNA primase large subunit n=1 Tax=Ixodes scapularis TaxID=6945 RepID=UPI001A9EB807|nr:DNA primase large subunit [Ixodes scapularis]